MMIFNDVQANIIVNAKQYDRIGVSIEVNASNRYQMVSPFQIENLRLLFVTKFKSFYHIKD